MKRKMSSTNLLLPFDSLVYFRLEGKIEIIKERKEEKNKYSKDNNNKPCKEESCKGHCLHIVPFWALSPFLPHQAGESA